MILDEFIAIARHHRKRGLRLLSQPADVRRSRRWGVAPTTRLHEKWLSLSGGVSARICGNRPKAGLPNMVVSRGRHWNLSLDPIVKEHILAASAATLERPLKHIRVTADSRRRRKRKPNTAGQRPGADLQRLGPAAALLTGNRPGTHCEGTLSESFIHSLVATDICACRTEEVTLLAREQSLVALRLKAIVSQKPFPVRGIDSDNDGAFISQTPEEYYANR